jgi:antitoxin component YwqK of YwqJK toxin-antitoxin module
MNLKPFFLFAITAIFFLSCSRRPHSKRIKKDGYTVEANFMNGRVADGNARYYDSSGKLINVTMYEKGVREGASINYFHNGAVSDSMQFSRDKEYGYWSHFDSNGNNIYKNYYYYGLPYGPEFIYENNKLKKFLFSDFNRAVIAECFYDDSGDMDSIGWFKMNFTITDRLYKNKPVKNLFGYLPDIPNTIQSFSVGLTNKEHAVKKLYSVEGHDFFIDTLLPIPPSGWYYYLGCNLNANKDSIKKFYIEEIISR